MTSVIEQQLYDFIEIDELVFVRVYVLMNLGAEFKYIVKIMITLQTQM